MSRISPVPPPNSGGEADLEIGVDGFEGLGELLARDLVDFLDGLLGIADGIDQVLALRAQEVVALLGFLKLFHGRGVDRAQRFDAVADFVGRLFGLGDGVGIGDRRLGVGQFHDRAVELLAAGLVEEFQLGLLADQVHFDLRALLHASPARPARSSLSSSSPARSLSRMPASWAAISLTWASSVVICSASTARLLVELDVVGQQAGAGFAQA